MARGKFGETLQAIEINPSTFVGIASAEGGAGSQVHVIADGAITLHFPTTDKVFAVIAGFGFVAGPGCTGVTSTADVIIS